MSTRTTATPPPHAEFFPPPAESLPPPPRVFGVVADDIRELVRFWPVVQNMVSQELRVRYQRSALGFFWTLLNPILMMATLAFFFSKMLGRGNAKTYAIYLFAGMVPWNLLATTISDCAFCIIYNEGLIRKIYLPKLVFPLTRLLVGLTTFALSMVAMFVLLIPLGAPIRPALIALPVVVVLFSAFTLGLGLLIATSNTFFRDTSHLVTVFLQAWYFATPIIYHASDFGDDSQWKFWINPAYPFVRMFHAIISAGKWPDPTTFALATVIALATLGVGYAAFKSNEDKLVFRL